MQQLKAGASKRLFLEAPTAVRLELTRVAPIHFESIALTARPSCPRSSTGHPHQRHKSDHALTIESDFRQVRHTLAYLLTSSISFPPVKPLTHLHAITTDIADEYAITTELASDMYSTTITLTHSLSTDNDCKMQLSVVCP